MFKKEVYLENLEDGLDLVHTLTTFKDDVDLEKGSICVDGKSMIGVSALGFPLTIDCVLHSDNEITIGIFEKCLDKFIAKKVSAD